MLTSTGAVLAIGRERMHGPIEVHERLDVGVGRGAHPQAATQIEWRGQ